MIVLIEQRVDHGLNIFPGKYSYYGLLVLGVIDIVWIMLAGHTIVISTLISALAGIVICAACLAGVNILARLKQTQSMTGEGQILARVPPVLIERLKTLLGGTIFLLLGWILLRLFNHLAMTIPIPYADGLLASMDQGLGLNWNAYFKFVAGSPFLVSSLDVVYTGLTMLSVLAFYILVVAGEREKARYFTIVFVVTALICTVAGIFFPAQAAVEYLQADPSLLANFKSSPGTYSVDILERLRSGDRQIFRIDSLPGLTTFPSFHTAAGIVLIAAFRRTFLFYPMCVYTAVMIASTPIYGGHYFVDLMAGTVTAILVCMFIERKWFPSLYKASAEFEGQSDISGVHAGDHRGDHGGVKAW